MKKIKMIVVNRREPAGSRPGSCYADLLFFKAGKNGRSSSFSNEEITDLVNNLNYFFNGKQNKVLFTCENGFILLRNYRYYWSGGSHSGAPETAIFNYLSEIYDILRD